MRRLHSAAMHRTVLGDTIHAVSSPPGAAVRGVVRISGPDAFVAAARLVAELEPSVATRCSLDGVLKLRRGSTMPVFVLCFPGPRSFTGENCCELHLHGSPLLLEMVCTELTPVSRPATPGEFTRRAFENGRLDLGAAQAVIELIHAEDEAALRSARHALDGGLGRAALTVGSAVDDALGWLEAGLDFEDVELDGGGHDEAGGTAGSSGMAQQAFGEAIAKAEQAATVLRAALPPLGPSGGDIALVGAVNAGKSSLCNALVGTDQVLATDVPGTTRDVLSLHLPSGHRILDTPGVTDAASEAIASRARDRFLAGSDALRVLVVDASEDVPAGTPAALRSTGGRGPDAVVWTKVDLVDGRAPNPLRVRALAACLEADVEPPTFCVSSADGSGVEALQAWIASRPRRGPGLGAARIRAAVEEACAALARARDAVAAGLPPELLAVDLRAAREAVSLLEPGAAARVDDAVLDRVFGAFCLGK